METLNFRNFYHRTTFEKSTVFISADDETVYLVNGIIDSWNEMLGDHPTPFILKATLLLFKNVIISDGLVNSYAIRFGRNSAAEFKETYMNAKRNGNILTKDSLINNF